MGHSFFLVVANISMGVPAPSPRVNRAMAPYHGLASVITHDIAAMMAGVAHGDKVSVLVIPKINTPK